ncbi:hypothetical protein [Ectopseudomonas khazarica]|uniref:hypothetical protein n=1 Tax=Ectopseudomonas khazarica TaxID=2502979 RepID=UPI0017BA1E83
MLKNATFLIICIALAALAWGTFQLLGNHAFLIMLLITVALLVRKAKSARIKRPSGD